MKRRKRRWTDLSPAERVVIGSGAVVQFALAGYAWADLARRPAASVRGPKRVWGFVIAINFIGPAAYLCFGRR
ncbi:PLDc N-terminal domain-containing protein [Prauserella flavalba]|uniref:Cardiolipin synthase N-terminal domain-containing protein n=1 Tax=Prauserella flavalba TaxID=1477506 RepID=A0A318LNR2_9PSEU|nr:PLDc N-terminal domain-containing protein [Prauserella flavalba]PXY36153.1 hypothetical protein BA062_11990 [Prauserella flavalba]